jgi:uncharacterized protein
MKHSNGLSSQRGYRVDILISHSRLLVSFVVAISILLFFIAPRLQTDPSLKSMLVTSSEPYSQYEAFLKDFGDDDYVVVAIRDPRGADDSAFLESVQRITNELANSNLVADIISATNLKVFQRKRELFGSVRLVQNENGRLILPPTAELMRIRSAVPLVDLIVSEDLKTVGILIRLRDEYSFDVGAIQSFVDHVQTVVRRNLPPSTDFRTVGGPVLRLAVANYSYQTAVIYGILASLLCSIVTVYITRSIKMSLLALVILGICALWVMGVMGLMGYPLNAATSISFGLILITSLEMVIHIVIRYNQFRILAPSREDAMKETVRYLFKPFLFCTATTAVGFGSCMVDDVPMVFQLGFIMSLGVTLSFFLAMILVPAAILWTNSGDMYISDNKSEDIVSRILRKVRQAIAEHHRQFTVLGFALTGILFTGAPLLHTNPQLLHQLGPQSREVRDLEFVANNLTSVHFLQVVLDSEIGEAAFKNPDAWKKVKALEQSLREMPEVLRTESMLGVLEYVHEVMAGAASQDSDIFSTPTGIAQLLLVTSMEAQGRNLIQRHLDEEFSKIRISVRIKNSPSVTVLETIEEVKRRADSIMKGTAKSTVTGELVMLAEQGDELVRGQILSMFIALFIITVLLMIQMGTPLFGLVSLIPNIPPIAAVFGIMGWLSIPLDGVNIFAATVAVGLAVNNTVHFVTQLKREIKMDPFSGVRENVFRAYQLAAKPMASWSVVTILGFLALAATPFHAASSFGVLVSSALLMGMLGDLVFMQSMILTSSSLRRLIRKVIDREIGDGKR